MDTETKRSGLQWRTDAQGTMGANGAPGTAWDIRESSGRSLQVMRAGGVPIEGTEQNALGTSQAVQWLRLCACNAGGVDLIPGTKIPYAT